MNWAIWAELGALLFAFIFLSGTAVRKPWFLLPQAVAGDEEYPPLLVQNSASIGLPSGVNRAMPKVSSTAAVVWGFSRL